MINYEKTYSGAKALEKDAQTRKDIQSRSHPAGNPFQEV